MKNSNRLTIAVEVVRGPSALSGGGTVCTIESIQRWTDRSKRPREERVVIDVWSDGAAGRSLEKYAIEGTRITVTGRFQQNWWKGMDGVERQSIAIKASSMAFVSGWVEYTA
jgi:single-stranded DNA-binding protein